jgi:2-aminoethylphosphonate-pyruvate transaminase
VHVLYALSEALLEMEEEGGWTARHATYAARARTVRETVARLGVEPFLGKDLAASSSILTSFTVPPHVRYEALHDSLKERGFVIYAGQGPYEGRIFRIAVMGDLQPADMEELVLALTHALSPAA